MKNDFKLLSKMNNPSGNGLETIDFIKKKDDKVNFSAGKILAGHVAFVTTAVALAFALAKNSKADLGEAGVTNTEAVPAQLVGEDDGIDYASIEANNQRIMDEQAASIEIAYTPLGEYEVQEGDSLFSIVQRDYGIAINDTMAEDLLDAFGISSTKMKMGDILMRPSPFDVHVCVYGFPDEDPDAVQ